jgi:hypothetical protein
MERDFLKKVCHECGRLPEVARWSIAVLHGR